MQQTGNGTIRNSAKVLVDSHDPCFTPDACALRLRSVPAEELKDFSS